MMPVSDGNGLNQDTVASEPTTVNTREHTEEERRKVDEEARRQAEAEVRQKMEKEEEDKKKKKKQKEEEEEKIKTTVVEKLNSNLEKNNPKSTSSSPKTSKIAAKNITIERLTADQSEPTVKTTEKYNEFTAEISLPPYDPQEESLYSVKVMLPDSSDSESNEGNTCTYIVNQTGDIKSFTPDTMSTVDLAEKEQLSSEQIQNLAMGFKAASENEEGQSKPWRLTTPCVVHSEKAKGLVAALREANPNITAENIQTLLSGCKNEKNEEYTDKNAETLLGQTAPKQKLSARPDFTAANPKDEHKANFSKSLEAIKNLRNGSKIGQTDGCPSGGSRPQAMSQNGEEMTTGHPVTHPPNSLGSHPAAGVLLAESFVGKLLGKL